MQYQKGFQPILVTQMAAQISNFTMFLFVVISWPSSKDTMFHVKTELLKLSKCALCSQEYADYICIRS